MKYINFDFNGQTYAMSFTAEALFRIYDKYGVTDDIIGTTKCFEPTEEGWRSCCWIAALLLAEGELIRRARGEEPIKMLTPELLRTGLMAADAATLRKAVRAAFEQGIKSEYTEEQTEEINLILAEREKEDAKAQNPFASALSTLRSLLDSSISHPPTL